PPSPRMLRGGGGPKPPELFFEAQREMGVRIVHGYGMTECPMITMGRPSDTDDQLAYTDGAPVAGCVVKIVRADGSVASPGEEGAVRVGGPMLFPGYPDPAHPAARSDPDVLFP